MKRLPKKEDMKSSLIKRFFRIVLVILILLIIGIIALLFTNYEGYGDRIKALVKPTLTVKENIVQKDTLEHPTELVKKDSSLFNFNTHYEKLDSTPFIFNDSIPTPDQDTLVNGIQDEEIAEVDLIEEVILDTVILDTVISDVVIIPNVSNLKPIKVITDEVDSSAINRIIAIAGKNLLLNKNRDDQESIILILAESANIKSISLSDKNGVIVFSTDQKNVGKLLQKEIIANIMGDEIMCDEDKSTCLIPIYYTFGKLGYAIVKKENEKAYQ